ncbi:MAG: hypothetical protein ACU841_03030 [Gammaproteobacteria bacterium]
MYEVVKLLFDIGRFIKRPGDLPYSLRLQKLLFMIFALVRFLMLNMATDWKLAIYRVVVEMFYIGGFSWIMLYFDRRLQRFCQVTCAFYGVYAVLGFMALPVAASLGIGRGGWIVILAMVAMFGWFCAVTVHIIYHTLDQRLSLSIGVGLLFLIGAYLLLEFAFPDQSGFV